MGEAVMVDHVRKLKPEDVDPACRKCDTTLTLPPADHEPHGKAPPSQLSMHHNEAIPSKMIEDMFLWRYPGRIEEPFWSWRQKYVRFHNLVATLEPLCIACHFPRRYPDIAPGTAPLHTPAYCAEHALDALARTDPPTIHTHEAWQDFEVLMLDAAVDALEKAKVRVFDWDWVARKVGTRSHQACRQFWEERRHAMARRKLQEALLHKG
jgi:hypothetical protein